MVMYGGRIIERGASEDIFTAPAEEYTRALIGSIPGSQQDVASHSQEVARGNGAPFTDLRA
jgi:ABC-type dipeptide/oligopeptide/nickel transport system ATPase component